MASEWVCALCEATSKGTAVKRAKHDLSICSWCEAELARTGRLRCRACSGTFPIAEIGKHPRHCAACRTAKNRAYYQANAEREKARARANYDPARFRVYYHQYRDIRRAKNRAEYHANPERSKARIRRYREKHREAARVYARTYYWSNVEERRAYARARKVQMKLAILRGLR